MEISLKEIANIQMGYSFRSRLEQSDDGSVAVVQMKDLREDNIVDCSRLMKIDMPSVKDHHLARRGDLLFRSRGLVNTSALLVDDPGRAVVGAPLLRVRVLDTGRVLPEYLNWYISQKEAQSYFLSRSEGTAVKKIGIRELEDLEVPLPEIKKQEAIVELSQLALKERILLQYIAEKREKYMSAIMMELAKEK